MKGTYGLPDVSEICFFAGDAGRDDSAENRPDWEAFRREVRESFSAYDSVALVQINPKYNDGAYEKKAEEIISQELGIPASGATICIRRSTYRNGVPRRFSTPVFYRDERFL